MLWSVSNHKSDCNALNKKIFKRGYSVQYVLVFYEGLYDCKEHHLAWISCPESLKRYQLSLETSDGHCLPDFRSADPQLSIFSNQTINTFHRPSLVRKLFLLGVWPSIFLCP